MASQFACAGKQLQLGFQGFLLILDDSDVDNLADKHADVTQPHTSI